MLVINWSTYFSTTTTTTPISYSSLIDSQTQIICLLIFLFVNICMAIVTFGLIEGFPLTCTPMYSFYFEKKFKNYKKNTR